MLSVYHLSENRLVKSDASALSNGALWIDLLEPTMEEEAAVEGVAGIDVPTREEMQEIEASSRLYRAGDALYMTSPVLTNADSANPQSIAVTFILTRKSLVTVRYGTPKSFETFAQRAVKQRDVCCSAPTALLALLETITDRLADVMERVAGDLERLSHQVFQGPVEPRGKPTDFQAVLLALGRSGDLDSKLRESLLGIGRLTTYLATELIDKKDAARLKTVVRDIRSLTEHAASLSAKISFLLDATLGMITYQQNNTNKIMSVVAVFFLPPTLIASIYGMNFELMPELNWEYGFYFALGLMAASMLGAWWFFKRRGWL